MKGLFEICVPRDDIRSGTARDSDFAADLAQVLIGTAPPEYMNPELFFANTYPTQGLQRLLENIGLRLRDQGGEASSIFRLDTQYGGGNPLVDRISPSGQWDVRSRQCRRIRKEGIGPG